MFLTIHWVWEILISLVMSCFIQSWPLILAFCDFRNICCIGRICPVTLPSRKWVHPILSWPITMAFICEEKVRPAVEGAKDGNCSKLHLFLARRYFGSQNSSSGCVVLDSIHLRRSSTDSWNCLVRRLSLHKLRCVDRSSGIRQFGHLSSAPGVIRDTCSRDPQKVEACFASQSEYMFFFFFRVRCSESQSTSSNCSLVHLSSLI